MKLFGAALSIALVALATGSTRAQQPPAMDPVGQPGLRIVAARVGRQVGGNGAGARGAAEGTRLGQGVVIRPAPTHYEIAARIGSHREAVTREFNRLEENRIVEIRRRQIRIVNLDLLRSDDLA